MMNDQDRFDFEVTREVFEMDQVNNELQILAQELVEEEQRLAYADYVDEMLHSFYEECFLNSEWETYHV